MELSEFLMGVAHDRLLCALLHCFDSLLNLFCATQTTCLKHCGWKLSACVD